jgi:hypothetical protein
MDKIIPEQSCRKPCIIYNTEIVPIFGILLYSDTGFHFSFPGLHLSLSMCWFFCQRSNHKIKNTKNCHRFCQK